MNIAVIGAGAAGMMAAIAAKDAGASVTLVDGNEKLGKKLYITGKGRCNVTNDAPPEEFYKNVVRNPRFLYSSYAAFDNRALMEELEKAGVPLKVERGGRVFPQSDKASDITKALEKRLRGVHVILGAKVLRIEQENDGFVLILPRTQLRVDRVILATGGVSYPMTGSDGSGLALAQALGHEIVRPLPALVPLITKESWCATLSGLTLKNVILRATRGKKKIYEELGEMLFTHFGVSGPLVLTLSSYITGEDLPSIDVCIDLKPGLSQEQLDGRILRDFKERSRAQVSSVADGLLPRSLTPIVLEAAQVAGDTPCNQVTGEMRMRLVHILKGLPLHIAGFGPMAEAIVTRGGVKINQIRPGSMESKKVPGLYFAGEMMDIDALTGGFNLQIAFSTGYCAGTHAAQDLTRDKEE